MAEGMRIDLLDDSITDDFHFFESMGDTLFRVLGDKCQIEVVWVDSAPVIFLRNVRRRDLGDVTHVIRREMNRWQYDEKAKVARLRKGTSSRRAANLSLQPTAGFAGGG